MVPVFLVVNHDRMREISANLPVPLPLLPPSPNRNEPSMHFLHRSSGEPGCRSCCFFPFLCDARATHVRREKEERMSGLRKNLDVLPLCVERVEKKKQALEKAKEKYFDRRQEASKNLQKKLYKFLENDEDFAILMADKDSYAGVKFEMREWDEPDDIEDCNAGVLSIGYHILPKRSNKMKVLYFDGEETLCSTEESV